MAQIVWNETLSVGIGSLDDQHKKLVGYVNDLQGAVQDEHSKDAIRNILLNLIDYSLFHFQTEEKLFGRYSYPQASEHINEHLDFEEKVRKFVSDYKNGKITLSLALMDFLKNWLINHIMVTDKQYSKFLISNGVN
jgi:hemerythrin-like metal-binding protein